MAVSERGYSIKVTTDQRDADAMYSGVRVKVKAGVLRVTRAGRLIAMYAKGSWIKVDIWDD